MVSHNRLIGILYRKLERSHTFLYAMPHALQRVLGPSGPRRIWGVALPDIPHLKHLAKHSKTINTTNGKPKVLLLKFTRATGQTKSSELKPEHARMDEPRIPRKGETLRDLAHLLTADELMNTSDLPHTHTEKLSPHVAVEAVVGVVAVELQLLLHRRRRRRRGSPVRRRHLPSAASIGGHQHVHHGITTTTTLPSHTRIQKQHQKEKKNPPQKKPQIQARFEPRGGAEQRNSVGNASAGRDLGARVWVSARGW